MEIVKRDTTSITLPESLSDTYQRMASRAIDPGKFVRPRKNGFVDSDEEKVADQFVAEIIDSEDYYYQWISSDNGLEIEKHDINKMSYETAKSKGLQLGVLLTFTVLEPDGVTGETLRCGLAEMSAQEFDRYVKKLKRKGLTPSHVYTRIYYQIVQTREGGPQPKVMFQAIGKIEEEPIDVTPTPASETTSVPPEWETD